MLARLYIYYNQIKKNIIRKTNLIVLKLLKCRAHIKQVITYNTFHRINHCIQSWDSDSTLHLHSYSVEQRLSCFSIHQGAMDYVVIVYVFSEKLFRYYQISCVSFALYLLRKDDLHIFKKIRFEPTPSNVCSRSISSL